MSLIRVSEKKLAANRANARLSRGPSTPEGKERSSRNACKHHLYAKKFQLPPAWQARIWTVVEPCLAGVDDPLERSATLHYAVLNQWLLELFAYEMAVGVADADGVHTPAEGKFLEQLAAALGLPAARAKEIVQEADAVAAAPGIAVATGAAAAPAAPVTADAAALDKRILDASITNAALELLPESIATMAILPLQARLVYTIGKAYGYELDQGHIKEFAATLGVGLTGQYLEQIGRRILGGVLGGVLGGMGRSIGRQAASSGMAFATTWAVGQVAKQYYGGGRTLDADKLKAAFQPLLSQGRTMIATYAPQIEERARSIDLKKLPSIIGKV